MPSSIHPRQSCRTVVQAAEEVVPRGVSGGTRRLGDGIAGNLHVRSNRDGVQIHLAQQGGDLIAAELSPNRIAGGGFAGAVEQPVEAGDGDRVVAFFRAGVSDVVEVEAVHIVVGEDVHADIEGVLLDFRVAGIKRVFTANQEIAVDILEQPIRVQIDHVVGLRRQRVGSVALPYVVGHHPGVDFKVRAGLRVVGLGHQVSQGVVAGADRGAEGFIMRIVEGVAPAADLGHDGVEMPSPRIGDILARVRRRVEIRAPGIGEPGAEFVCRRRCSGQQDKEAKAQGPWLGAEVRKTASVHRKECRPNPRPEASL